MLSVIVAAPDALRVSVAYRHAFRNWQPEPNCHNKLHAHKHAHAIRDALSGRHGLLEQDAQRECSRHHDAITISQCRLNAQRNSNCERDEFAHVLSFVFCQPHHHFYYLFYRDAIAKPKSIFLGESVFDLISFPHAIRDAAPYVFRVTIAHIEPFRNRQSEPGRHCELYAL